jgi:hypothetical protein
MSATSKGSDLSGCVRNVTGVILMQVVIRGQEVPGGLLVLRERRPCRTRCSAEGGVAAEFFSVASIESPCRSFKQKTEEEQMASTIQNFDAVLR